MRFHAVLFAIIVLGIARGDDTPTKPITVAEAVKKVNEKVTVEMEVKSTGGKGNCFLNSEADYKDANNFTIFIPKETKEKFEKVKIDDPQKHFKGKTVLVTGTVTLYQKKPQIKLEDPDQIKVIEKK
jgi:DNA/RNA endonuclease YhcR with UshA esterase domain